MTGALLAITCCLWQLICFISGGGGMADKQPSTVHPVGELPTLTCKGVHKFFRNLSVPCFGCKPQE